MKNGLESAYDYCQELTRREAKNFYYGFVLLPSDQRRAIYAAYAFARRCDDIVDEGLPIETASERLQEYRASLDSCLAGCPDGPAFEALRHAIDACRIPPGYFHELIDGVQMDLTVTRYASFDDLRRYCYLVASVVGLICIEVFGYRGAEKARSRAADLGVALQLTNILRDVREDAERGRIYIPQDDLAAFGYSEQELFAGKVTPAFKHMMVFQAERAQKYYESGRLLLPYLPRRARACVGAMAGIYRSILAEIQRDPSVVFERRVSISSSRKLALASRELVRSLAP